MRWLKSDPIAVVVLILGIGLVSALALIPASSPARARWRSVKGPRERCKMSGQRLQGTSAQSKTGTRLAR
jgi:hypothetical protein